MFGLLFGALAAGLNYRIITEIEKRTGQSLRDSPYNGGYSGEFKSEDQISWEAVDTFAEAERRKQEAQARARAGQ